MFVVETGEGRTPPGTRNEGVAVCGVINLVTLQLHHVAKYRRQLISSVDAAGASPKDRYETSRPVTVSWNQKASRGRGLEALYRFRASGRL